MLQNRGFGFRLERGHPNCIAPFKRPMHTIIPGMVTQDGAAVMPFGVMGGHYQPMGQTSFLTNFLDYGLDLQESLDLCRLFPTAGKVQVERGVPAPLRAGLAALGHVIEAVDWPHGGGQAIWIDRARGCLVGALRPAQGRVRAGILTRPPERMDILDPCDLTAREARALIGCKTLSPVELVESCIARIAGGGPRRQRHGGARLRARPRGRACGGGGGGARRRAAGRCTACRSA